jgi:squalene-hopene/tetraprenyl-beta-curcumene cyclase
MYLPVVTPPGGAGWLRGAQGLVDRIANTLVEYGDPSTADVTGRVLWTFAELGATVREPAVRAAVDLIKYQRYAGNGAWWGMWAVNFLPSSAYILTGLLRVGEPPDAAYIAEALRFITERQRDDGAWGETTESYMDPELAGRGPAMRHVTAYCVWALCDAGRAASESVTRGVEYLLSQQQADGFWTDSAPLGVMMPNAGYYGNSSFSTYVAVEALAAYRRAVG